MTMQRLVTGLCVAVCFSLIGLSLQQKADLRLEVEPRYTHVSYGTPATLTCTLRDGGEGREPLAACGFSHHGSGAAWDIETGLATINHTIEGEVVTGTITNPGDEAGSCSLKIEYLPGGPYMLGCRVRPASGGAWRYADMMVLVDERAPQQYRLQPAGVSVSLPGSVVTISGEAEEQVDECRFFLPPDNTEIYLNSWDTSKNTTRYRVWIEGRRCAVTLLDIQPRHSGFVYSWMRSSSTDRTSADFMKLIVANPCSPSPCGPHSLCSVHGSFATCSCQPRYIGQPPSCRPECSVSGHCPLDKACVNQTCQDPCLGTGCGQDAVCKMVNHVPTCQCPVNFRGDPKILCEPRNPCSSNPCGEGNVCLEVGSVVACSCQTSHEGRWPHCQP